MDQKSRKSLYEVVWFDGGERQSSGQIKDGETAKAIYDATRSKGLVTILVTTTPCMRGGQIEPDLY